MIGIYKFENKINHKCYIGQSIDLEKRRLSHKYSSYNENALDYNSQFHQAIRKYGFDNFNYEILKILASDEYSKSLLNELEINYILKYNSYQNGYNATPGGEYGVSQKGEKNGRAILKEEEVFYIRECYNAHIPFKIVYEEFSDKITKRCLQKVWRYETWKDILPEYHTDANKYFHSHQAKALSSEQASKNSKMMSTKQRALNAMKISIDDVYKIREMYDNGSSPKKIKEKLKLPIGISDINRIGKRIRCNSI